MKLKWPNSATRFGKKSPNWQKVTKVAKSPQIRLQGVSDGSWSQTAWAWTTRGTYARAPYAFAALGQGPKGPELVNDNTSHEIVQKCAEVVLEVVANCCHHPILLTYFI